MTQTAHALGALLAAVVMSTSSVALAIEPPPQAPPSEDAAPPPDETAAPAPDTREAPPPDQKAQPPAAKAHHGCMWAKRGGFAASSAVAPRLVRWGITAGVATAAVATTAALAGAVTLATAIPACAANPGACRAVLQAPLSRAPGMQPSANVRAPLTAR